MDAEKILDLTKRESEQSLQHTDQLMENHLKASAIVLNNAEVMREEQTLPSELAAIAQLANSPLAVPPKGDES